MEQNARAYCSKSDPGLPEKNGGDQLVRSSTGIGVASVQLALAHVPPVRETLFAGKADNIYRCVGVSGRTGIRQLRQAGRADKRRLTLMDEKGLLRKRIGQLNRPLNHVKVSA